MADAPPPPQSPGRTATAEGRPDVPTIPDAKPVPNDAKQNRPEPPPLAPVPGIPLPPKPPRTDAAKPPDLADGAAPQIPARLAPLDARPPRADLPPQPVGRLETGLPEIKPVPGVPPPPDVKPVPGVPPPEKPSAISAAKDKMADAVQSVKSYMTIDKVKMGLGAGFILVHVAVGVLAYFGLKYPSVELPPGF